MKLDILNFIRWKSKVKLYFNRVYHSAQRRGSTEALHLKDILHKDEKNYIMHLHYPTYIDYFIAKCTVRIFIHELQNFGKRTNEHSERVSLPKICNE